MGKICWGLQPCPQDPTKLHQGSSSQSCLKWEGAYAFPLRIVCVHVYAFVFVFCFFSSALFLNFDCFYINCWHFFVGYCSLDDGQRQWKIMRSWGGNFLETLRLLNLYPRHRLHCQNHGRRKLIVWSLVVKWRRFLVLTSLKLQYLHLVSLLTASNCYLSTCIFSFPAN